MMECEKERSEHVLPPWADLLEEGEFISYLPSYEVGAYFHLFDKLLYHDDTLGDITYYIFDPIKHGAPKDRKYPICMWYHGASNSLVGEVCISYSGAEMFASPEYQKRFGGAYIVVPLANEERIEDGRLTGCWNDSYIKPMKGLFDEIIRQHADTVSVNIIFGNSCGSSFCWSMTKTYPEFLHGAVIVSGANVPTDEELRNIDTNNVHIIVAHGKRDELTNFDQYILPHVKMFGQMKHCICYFPEWVKNGDGGIASINYGVEMGQHCLINQFQANLMYQDGTCYDERLPEGITGWLNDILM